MKFFLLALAVIGLLSVILPIAGTILIPVKTEKNAFVVLPVSGHVEDIELRVRELVRESRGLRGTSVIIADFGADGETTEICRRLCLEFGNVEMVKGSGLYERFNCREDKKPNKTG